jgi:hypothetical protein
MVGPYRHLAALRAALLADTALAALVGDRVAVAYPWGVADAVYPRVNLWQEADAQAVSLPRTTDPARVRVDGFSQVDSQQAAAIYERVFLVLHKKEQALGLTGQVVIKECRQVWNLFPVWDPILQAWHAPTRFLVRAMIPGTFL